MAVQLVTKINRYIGTAAEIAALTLTGIPAGSTFFESDTGILKILNAAGALVEAPSSVQLSGSKTVHRARDTITMGGTGVGAHTALDVVSTETGEVLEFDTGLVAGGSGIILSSLVTLNQNAVFSGGAGYYLHLYNAAPTAIPDNAAYTLAAADLATYIGKIQISTLVDLGDNCAAHDTGHNIDFELAAEDTKLYGILVCIGGETTIDEKVITVNLNIAGQILQSKRYSYNPYANGGGDKYITGLHNHSNASDGALTPANLVALYEAAGYHVFAITDHDMVTAQPASTMLAISHASEQTTPTGHVSSLFSNYTRGAETDLQTIIDDIRLDGGLAFLNHPNWDGLLPYETCAGFTNYNGIEIFNSACESDEFSKTGCAVETWDSLLTNINPRILGIATDDFHVVTAYRKSNICRIIVFAKERTEAAIKEAIQNGCFVADVGCTGITLLPPRVTNDKIFLTCPGATAIRFIGENGALLQETTGDTANYKLTGQEKYVRPEVVSKYTDNFASDSGNWVYPYGTWSIADGVLKNTVAQDLPPASAMLAKPIYGDFDLYCEFTVNTMAAGTPCTVGIGLHCSEITNASGVYGLKTGYLYHMYDNIDAYLYKKIDDGTGWEEASSIYALLLETGKTYGVRIQRIGSALKCRHWDKASAEPSTWLEWEETTYNHGWIRLFCRNATASFDNFELNGIKSYYQPIVGKG